MARKLEEFKVTIEVDDHGEFEPSLVRKAIQDGLSQAHAEGNLTLYEDKTTEIMGWTVTHEGTAWEG